MTRTSKGLWVGVGLLLCAASFVRLVVIGTFESRAFFREKMARLSDHPWTQPFPTGSVVMYSVLIVVEAGLMWVILTRSRTAIWLRAMTCAAAALMIAVAATAFGLYHFHHAPPYAVYHIAWLVCSAAGMVAIAVISAVWDQAQRGRARRFG